MRAGIVALLALVACAGCAGAVDAELAEHEAVDAAHVDDEPERPAIPLCSGSPEPEPGLCQELRYGEHGYCNRWVECDSL